MNSQLQMNLDGNQEIKPETTNEEIQKKINDLKSQIVTPIKIQACNNDCCFMYGDSGNGNNCAHFFDISECDWLKKYNEKFEWKKDD